MPFWTLRVWRFEIISGEILLAVIGSDWKVGLILEGFLYEGFPSFLSYFLSG